MRRGRYRAGIINYHSYRDVESCLDSLAEQSHPPLKVTVVDHDPDPTRLRAARLRNPEVEWLAGPNRGFAGGANRLIANCEQSGSDVPFLLLLNPDVRLGRYFAQRLIDALLRHADVALGSGKLLRPDGRKIDSAGIEMSRNRRLRDRGSGEIDRGQYDRVESVFGVSGAALMLRRSAIPDLDIDGEVFDEDFFTYHEETDLAWRARLLGWKSLYVPQATATHRRAWSENAWRQIDPRVRRHSFTNRYLEMIKNERPRDFLRDLHSIAAWEVLRIGHAVVRDPSRIPSYASAARLAARAWRKRRVIQERIRRRESSSPARSN